MLTSHSTVRISAVSQRSPEHADSIPPTTVALLQHIHWPKLPSSCRAFDLNPPPVPPPLNFNLLAALTNAPTID